jgi:hypothetical protein
MISLALVILEQFIHVDSPYNGFYAILSGINCFISISVGAAIGIALAQGLHWLFGDWQLSIVKRMVFVIVLIAIFSYVFSVGVRRHQNIAGTSDFDRLFYWIKNKTD